MTGAGAMRRTSPPPADARSAVDAAYERIVAAIGFGEFLPGSSLPDERTLAAHLGVSRVTLRQAIARLVDRGILVTVRGRAGGHFVSEQIPEESAQAIKRSLRGRIDELRDLCEAISLIHGAIARAAATNHSERELEVVRERLSAWFEAEPGRASQEADGLLHEAILAAAGNETLRRVLFQLESQVSLSAPIHVWGQPDMWVMERRANADHIALVDAIQRRAVEEAGTIAQNHAWIDFEMYEQALVWAQRQS